MKKKQNKKEDTISKLKKEEEKIKKQTKKEEEEDNSDEEGDQKNTNVVKQQVVQKADKPKNLKELLFSVGDNKPKAAPKKETKQNAKKYEEPGKHNFVNTKGTANADIIDREAKNRKNPVYKNAKNLDKAAKENEKIKHTKDYLEKDVKKQYTDVKEDVAKPQFTSNIKEGEENFVELNKDEDVRKNFYLLLNKYSYWLEIWLI